MIDHHRVSIMASAGKIFPHLVKWGESGWWPQDTPMRYTRLTGGDIGVGTRYRQKVEVPFGPKWEVEVVDIRPGRSLSRRFMKGMFRGVESLYLEQGPYACDVNFRMDFKVVGPVNRLLWRYVYKKRHEANIRKILDALKGHMERASHLSV